MFIYILNQEELKMKFTKKIIAGVLVVALSITTFSVGAFADTKDATNSVPNKKSLMKLVDEFSTPVGVIEQWGMKSGVTKNMDFKKRADRAEIIRYIATKKSEIKPVSKRLFGKKTSKVQIYPGEWGNSRIVMVVHSIKKTSNKDYYVKGTVYISLQGEKKSRLCGTFRLYVQKKAKAKYKYVAKKLSLTTYKKATFKTTKINAFKSAKKYKNIKATMTYHKITVSGVDGASKINSVLNKDYNNFVNSTSATNFYKWVAEDNAKGKKGTYYYTATAKVKYNMNNILSIRISIKWYAGTVVNTDEYGYNFNAKTGKKIGIKNVCYGSTKTIKKNMYAAINNTKGLKKYAKKAKKLVKKTKLKKLEFYLQSDKVVICFKPYTLGKKQRKFKTFSIYSRYF